MKVTTITRSEPFEAGYEFVKEGDEPSKVVFSGRAKKELTIAEVKEVLENFSLFIKHSPIKEPDNEVK